MGNTNRKERLITMKKRYVRESQDVCAELIVDRIITCGAAILLCFLLAAGTVFAAESSEERFGATDDAVGPLGGGKGYTKMVTKYDYLVKTEQELIDTLKKAKAGEVVYVEDKAELDFSPWVIVEEVVMEIPAGVTLASGRGKDGSEGALLYSNAFKTEPLFRVTGADVRITGLRVRGPDPKIRKEPVGRWGKEGRKKGEGNTKYYKWPRSDGIIATGANLEVDNCELWGWNHVAVYLNKGADNGHIHHNNIHHNRRTGLGYGVVADSGSVLIESNVFDYNRHSIASSGWPGNSYEASNNLVGPHANSHLFDMHGGRDRKDGTDIAGASIKVHHNTFQAPDISALVVRGTPSEKVEVHHNWFYDTKIERVVRPAGKDFINIYRNQFGPKRKLVE